VSSSGEATGVRVPAAPAPRSRTEGWWPSRFGVDDEAGALNEITPAKVVEAVRLVRRGTVFDLAHVLHADIPAFPGRTFRQYLTTNSHQVNRRRAGAGPAGLGRNSVNWIVEQVTATQQMGTHLDGLNHLQVGDRTYNGHALADIVEDHGTNRLGIDTLPQVVTRGLLLDIAAVRGVDRLGPGDVVTPADARAALQVAGLDVRPGDAVLFHTGWGSLWGVDDAAYGAGEPGPGTALGQWLALSRVSLTGCDTWSFGPYPPEDPAEPFVVPQTLNVRHGVVVAENLRLTELARAGVHEFLLVVSHAKLRGATGAWVAPLAIV
jgi:kynurenine formamidase